VEGDTTQNLTKSTYLYC